MMKSVLGNPLLVVLVLLIIEIIVIVIVVLEALLDTSGWPVLGPLFSFLRDWVLVISAILVCAGVLVFFTSNRLRFRDSALTGLHDWASRAVITLSRYRQENAAKDSESGYFDELENVINEIIGDSRGSLADEFLGSELRSVKKHTVRTLKNIKKKIRHKDKSAFDELPGLQHALADMMLVTFESASGKGSSGKD